MASKSSRQYPPTLMVVIASVVSAIVVTACGPDGDEPMSRVAVAPSTSQQLQSQTGVAAPQSASASH